jgi:hypothetical protein
MPKFRKKPVEIDAMQWDGAPENAGLIIDWMLANGTTATFACTDTDQRTECDADTPHVIKIKTLEGTMAASVGDWIIRGIQGEFYPCKPDIFEATYEPVAA